MGQIPRSKIAEILVEVLQSQQHIESQIPVMHVIGDSNLRNLFRRLCSAKSESITYLSSQNSWARLLLYGREMGDMASSYQSFDPQTPNIQFHRIGPNVKSIVMYIALQSVLGDPRPPFLHHGIKMLTDERLYGKFKRTKKHSSQRGSYS